MPRISGEGAWGPLTSPPGRVDVTQSLPPDGFPLVLVASVGNHHVRVGQRPVRLLAWSEGDVLLSAYDLRGRGVPRALLGRVAGMARVRIRP
jgi:hypothetical protein